MTKDELTILQPGEYTEEDVEQLRKGSEIWREVDIYASQLEELLEIKYPDNQQRQLQKVAFLKTNSKHKGAWVYYPWSGVLLHCIGPQELFELRTNRNQNLITKDEQQKLHSSVIGVAGMSVGAGIATGAVYAGISKTIKIADFDQLETANLNRIREALVNIGQAKVSLAKQHILELDPFSDVQTFSEGLTASNIDDFFSKPKLDVVVDEIDDFKLKVLLRVKSKENKIPLLMFTSLGDNILVDVERYDQNADQLLFNGAIGDVAEEILSNDAISDADIKRYAVQIVGVNYVPTRALESLLHIGTSLVGRPQLYSTVAVDGGLAAYIIRQMLLGADLKSGRYFIKFAEFFDIASREFTDEESRNNILMKIMGPKSEK